MIAGVEVIGKYNLTTSYFVEPSQCWFELKYYEIGECEIYALATDYNVSALQMGNYVKMPNLPYLWVIKSVEIAYSANGARMLSAKGYEAKWLLTQRAILWQWPLSGDLGKAIQALVNGNMGTTAATARKINGFSASAISIKDSNGKAISVEEVLTRGNLSEIVLAFLKSYSCGSILTYENGGLVWRALQGKDVSQTVMFAQSLDNLIKTDFYSDSSEYKNFCRVVSAFNENNVTTEYLQDVDGGQTGIDRSEIVLEANISTKYTDEQGQQQEMSPTSDLYKATQATEGKNALAEAIVKREFAGEIDVAFSPYVFGRDFFIGDLIGIRDESLGYQEKTRVLTYRFKQDSSGDAPEIEYGNE